jgi:parallel beta-helix repeat protein
MASAPRDVTPDVLGKDSALRRGVEWARRRGSSFSADVPVGMPADPMPELSPRRLREYLAGSPAVFNVKDTGARGDGATDDTAALQRAVDRAGAVGGTVLFPSGVYLFSATLGIRGDRTELVGLGGSRLVATAALDRLIDSNDFGALHFHGLTIEGTGVQTVGGRGTIHLDGGSRDCVVAHCRIVNAPGTAIADDGTRNLVAHNIVDGTGEHGIYSSSGVDSRYHGNHLRRIGQVPRTTLGCHGISLAGSRSCVVEGNAVEDTGGVGIALRDDARYCTVRGNAIRGGTDRHLALGTASDCDIVGNSMFDVAAGADAVRIDGGGRFVIADNLIRRTTAGGAAIRWTTAGVTGGDDVYGNLILLQGAAISQPGIDADSETLVDVRIHRNTIKAIDGAAPPGAIRVRTGAAVHVYDNDAQA